MAVEDELRKLFSDGKITAVEYDRLVSLQNAASDTPPVPPQVPTPPLPPAAPPPPVPPPPFPVQQPSVPPAPVPPAPERAAFDRPTIDGSEPALLAIARQMRQEAAPQRKGSSAGKIWAIVIGIILVILGALAALVIVGLTIQTSGLSLGNVQSRGTVIDVKLSNTATSGGDVVFAVTQGAVPSMCERVIAVLPQSNYDISFECPTLKDGVFEVRYMWAEYSDVANIAIRIPTTD